MRTTVRLPDDLLRRAKKLAVDTDRSLTRVIEDSLRDAIARADAPGAREPARLTTFGYGGVKRGVNLDEGRTLRDIMDASEGAESEG